jgi:hypothetical protein
MWPTNAGDELAYCSRIACLLTQSRDLPKLCQAFPNVVQAVNGNRVPVEDVMHQHHHHHGHFFEGHHPSVLAHSMSSSMSDRSTSNSSRSTYMEDSTSSSFGMPSSDR